jgi:WD40-like Beta Propeller Repeat
MQRQVAVGMGLALLVGSCSGGPSGASVAKKAAMCSASTDLDAGADSKRRLWTGRAVPRADVSRTLDAELDAARRLKENASKEFASASTKFLEELTSVNSRILNDWGDDGSELFARLDRDDIVPWIEYQTPSGRSLGERVYMSCAPPPAGWVAVGPRHPDRVPKVDLLAVRRVKKRLRLLSLHGRGETLLPAPDNLEVTAPTVSADGSRLAAVGYERARRVLLLGSPAGEDLAPSSPAVEQWMCPTFVDGERSLLVTRRTGLAAWSLGKLDRESGEVTALSRSGPLREALCDGVEVGESVVAVGHGDDGDGDYVLVRVIDPNKTPEPFARLDGCNIVFPQRRPNTERLYVIAGCTDPYRNGLWSVAFDGSDWRHELSGLIAAPRWSPDGAWLAFGYQKLGESNGSPSLWVTNADFTVMGQVAGPWTSWPTWRSSPKL